MLKIDDVIEAYMKLRANKEAIEREAKNKVSALIGKMELMEAWLLAKMEEDGVTSYKSPRGTAFKTTSSFANVADWDAMLEYVLANEAFHLLERRVNKLAVKSYIDEGQPPPPGVNYVTKLDINIRKPTAN